MASAKVPVIEVEPENLFRKRIYNFVRQDWFDHYFITSVILLNTVTMCMEYYGASKDYLKVLEICNTIFVGIFTLEAILKIIGYGPSYYFYIDWNKFDFAVMIMSLASLEQSDIL